MIKEEVYEAARSALLRLTEEGRLKVMADFCAGCGIYLIDEDGNWERCQCQNDD